MDESVVYQEGPAADFDTVTITTNVLGSSECSNALQVLCCALGRCAFGLHVLCELITAHS